jgi:hypothetical protein
MNDRRASLTSMRQKNSVGYNSRANNNLEKDGCRIVPASKYW